MGRAIGMNICAFVGVRVAGDLTYVLPHLDNGKQVNSRVIIPVYQNSHKGTNQRTGEKGRVDSFKFVAWGKMADVCCRSLPKGKAIDVFARAQSFEGKLFNIDGTVRVDHTGQPIKTTKNSYTIVDITFGEESSKQIAEEVQTGRRPVNWNVQGHPDFALWTQMLVAKQALVWDGRDPMFGYARVIVPQGPGIQVNFAQPTGAAPGYTQAPVYTAPAPAYGAPTYGAPAYTAPRAVPPIATPPGVQQYIRDANGNFVPAPAAGTLPSMVNYAVNHNAGAPPNGVTAPPLVASGQNLF